MSRWKKIVVCLLTVIVLGFGSLFLMMYWGMRPTTGAPIAEYSSPRTAMLIIDIQEDFTGPEAKKRYHDGDRIISTTNALLTQAKKQGIVVVYVQNIIDNPILSILTGGINSPGSPGTAIDRRILKLPGAQTFTKNRSDAFSSKELDAYLRKKLVNHLLITGLDAAYCVNATIRGGLNRGYRVTVFSDGVTTESGKKMDNLARLWRKAGARVRSGAVVEL